MPLSEYVYCVAITFKMTERIEQQICIKFCVPSCIMSHAEFFGEATNHPHDSVPLQPRFGALWLLAFPKTKITFEKEEISACQWDLKNTMRQLLAIRRMVWGPKVSTLKSTEGSLSCVQCFLDLVSPSINVTVFFILHGWIPSGQTSYITSQSWNFCFLWWVWLRCIFLATFKYIIQHY